MGFHVDKVFYLPQRDQLVLAGRFEGRAPAAGGAIDLPQEVKGPGWVPILDVQSVPFADGATKPCVVVDYAYLEAAPLMEFSSLEGLILEVRDP